MFNRSSTRGSGLTREDTKLIAEYLNATKKITDGRFEWEARIVPEHQSDEMDIVSQDPIIVFRAPRQCDYLYAKRGEIKEIEKCDATIWEYFREMMVGHYYHHHDSNTYYINDVSLLRQFKQEAYKWKSKKIAVSKNGMFGDVRAKDTEDFDFNQLMMDIATQTSDLIEKTKKKEAKSELTPSDFSSILNILVKVQADKEKEISSLELEVLINFNQKLAASGGEPKILEKLNIIASRIPRIAPLGGPAF